jgi:molybdopterin-binding protein
MNHLEGIVREIHTDKDVSLIEILVDGSTFSALTVSHDFHPGDQVSIEFKETAMSLAKSISGELSIRNRFDVIIDTLTPNNILTKVILNFHGTRLVSTITTSSAERMQLKTGDRVEGLVKTTDMHLSKG